MVTNQYDGFNCSNDGGTLENKVLDRTQIVIEEIDMCSNNGDTDN